MDRTLLAAALVVVSLAGAAQSHVPSAPATVVAQTILPEDFLSDDILIARDDADDAFDRMAGEVVDILLNAGREMLAG